MNTNQPTTNTPSTASLDDILNADSDALMEAGTESASEEPKPTWKRIEEILYQPIVITRANINKQFDKYQNKDVVRAFCNFHFADDPSREPFVFKTGWSAIRAQIARFVELNAFPVSCGVVEMLDKHSFVADGIEHYPLRLVSLDQLAARELESTAHANTIVETQEETIPPPPVAPAPATTTHAPTTYTRPGARPAPRGK